MLASWECIATSGRFIEIGKRDILLNNNLPHGMFLRNTMFRGFDLGGMMMDRPDLCLSALDDILLLKLDGTLRPVQRITTSGIGDVEAAFRLMQTGKHQRKLVIDVGMEDKVMTVLNTKPNFTCDGNATYVIAGGLGDIGQSIAAWLVDRGARTPPVLSRSGAKGPEAMKFINSLQSKGERAIAPACDISNESVLRKVLEEWQPQLPPIKGCIQAAMVLQDRTFESMSYKDWEAAVKPKAQGSWNLHCLCQGEWGSSFYSRPYRASFALMARLTMPPELPFRTLSRSTDPLHGYEFDCQPSIGAQPEVRERGSAAANWPEKPLFKCLALDEAHSQDLASREQTFQLEAAMENARSLPEGSHAVTRALIAKLSRALALDEKDIDSDKHLSKYGVDSLVAVELRMWFAAELKANIAIFDIIGSTVATIAQLAASRSKLRKGYSI
ncbi:KR domain-containing protein [Aspergillus arachidicola]|uniref:KR domain-containing protein n=1 Tax=Aspergillus arachidicola TaxID=656916 RepID=A0A2G7FML5_9EURO|nr:KR domain-containing protein [Aspergillus arachidicola]PIG81880.1 hypothetical protein AARAC_003698 [Aspergillus arachidicola]